LSNSPNRRRRSPNRNSPSLKNSSSRNYERFGKNSSGSRSPHRAHLRQPKSIQKELVEKQQQLSHRQYQSTKSQNMKHLQHTAERISSTISENDGENLHASITSSSAIIGINAHVRHNPDIDVLRNTETPTEQLTKE